MHILSVSFKNYKIFEDKTFIFDKNPFLFIAPNEAGKSTVIEGIRDVFSFSPEKLKAKKTKNKDVYPVVELKFKLDGCVYSIKLNAQDDTVLLKGEDGTELGKDKSIENFFNKKGYFLFKVVASSLLILKERDLSIDVGKGLSKLFDDVLKTARIEDLMRTIKNMLVFQKGSANVFKASSLGKEESRVRENLEKINTSILEFIKLQDEYVKNLEHLDNLKKALKQKELEKSQLEKQLDRLQKLEKYILFKKSKEKIDILGRQIEAINAKVNSLKKSEAEIEKAIKSLTKKRDDLINYVRQYRNIALDLKSKREKVKNINDKISAIQEIERIRLLTEPYEDKTVRDLKSDLVSWKALKESKNNYYGILEVVSASDNVYVEGSNIIKSNNRYKFKNSVDLKYKDLHLKIDVKDAKSNKIEEKLVKTYGSIKKLETLVELLAKKEDLIKKYNIDCNLEDIIESKRKLMLEIKDLEKKVRKIEKVEKEINDIFLSVQKLSEKLRKIQKDLRNAELEKREAETEMKHHKLMLSEFEKAIEDLTYKEITDFEEELKNLCIDDIRDVLDKKHNELEKIKNEILRLEKDISLYEGLTKFAPDSREFENLLSLKAEYEEKLRRMLKVNKMLRKGLEVLSDLRNEINRQYMRKFEEKVGDIFSKMTKGAYVGVKFDYESLFFDSTVFKTRWKVMRRDGVEFSIDELSDGASSQLLFSARLALIELFLGKKAFLLLDDPFAYFDEERTKEAMQILNFMASEGWQVILMSVKR